jgi:cytochrome P450
LSTRAEAATTAAQAAGPSSHPEAQPLECWAVQHFEQPIVAGGLPIGHVLLVHEPGAIRHVLLENAANYRKDQLQRRVLSAGLNDGLLSAEGEQWRLQRRVLAPMFAARTVMDFAPAMLGAAGALIDRWAALGDRATIDVSAEMARVTLDVVERTIFSDGFGSDAKTSASPWRPISIRSGKSARSICSACPTLCRG